MNASPLELAISQDIKSSLQNLDFNLEKQEKNPRIDRLLRSTVLSGGKRLRPMLTFLWADLCGISHDQIEPFAQVAELTHAATLAHDDVIDNAIVRRGKPSINVVSSNKKAVLAGDYLLASSLQIVAAQRQHESSQWPGPDDRQISLKVSGSRLKTPLINSCAVTTLIG